MSKLWIIGVLCVAAFLQVTIAKDVAEALNITIRDQLKGYQRFLEQDDGAHKADLAKLIEITESALKAETADEKQTILKSIEQQFTPEFNQFVATQLEEFQVNEDIHESIGFYNSLLAGHSEFSDEITKTIATLENLLKESNLKQKEESFLALDKAFSAEFSKFLKQNSLPNVDRDLKKTVDFFDNVLAQHDIKFETEIKQLKVQAEAALGDVTIDEKQSALYQVTNPQNRELYEYLQVKFIELN